jgi:putative N-acetylmannosamine-6-phosphate epimerase
MSEFIFMLTHNDETIPDAVEYVQRLGDSAVRYVGFKDIGLPEERLHDVVAAIRANGQTSVLEIVDVGSEDELRSVQAALRLGVDYIVGGTLIDRIATEISGSGMRFFPYVGDVVGHPARLEGGVDAIVAQARSAAQHPAVDGINVLAYRWTEGDGAEIAAAVSEAVDVPVIAAGSVDSTERIAALEAAGVWGFTIGGAVLTGQMVEGGSFEAQIAATLEAAGTPAA